MKTITYVLLPLCFSLNSFAMMEIPSNKGLRSNRAIQSINDLLSAPDTIDQTVPCCVATSAVERASPLSSVSSGQDLLKRADNFIIKNDKIGHKGRRSDYRVINADNSHFNNFILEDVKYIRGQAKSAKWTNFSISGKLEDWEFRDTTFEDGLFAVKFKNVEFRNVTFKNINWSDSNINVVSFKDCVGQPTH